MRKMYDELASARPSLPFVTFEAFVFFVV